MLLTMSLVKSSGTLGAELEHCLIAQWKQYLTPDASTLIYDLATMQADFVRTLVARGVDKSIENQDASLDYAALMERLFLVTSHESKPIPMPASATIVIAPHLGFSKLMSHRFLELLMETSIDVRSSVPNCEPWFWRHIAAWAVARTNSATLVPIEMRYGPPIADLQDWYGAIALNIDRVGATLDLVAALRSRHTELSRIVFSMFPEAGSSGKRQGAGHPFRLETFRKGFIVAAEQLHLPVLPIAHIVDRSGHSCFSALDPIWVNPPARHHDESEVIRKRMQGKMCRLLVGVDKKPETYL